ncbi:MAG TPA: S41 family peptidase [Patescibacteria group bacterium]|nr:S41 family peptidase [Patescibacteria group bacterium]
MDKRWLLVVVALVVFLLSGALYAAEESRLMRYPDIHGDKIVFSYGRDLWIVSSSGGMATRLTSHAGGEGFAKFSPDGETIAFSGSYDGNLDIYTIPAAGGVPKRITYHPLDDIIVDWDPKGTKILFRSVRESKTNPGPRYSRLFTIDREGGYPEALPLFEGELTSYSPDGTKIAYNRMSREFRTWKRYRGGMAQDIWLYDLVKNEIEQLTDFEGTDAFPMWYENRIYFISDREQTMNIYCLDLETRDIRKITDHKHYDVKWPSLGDGTIVYENGGYLYVLNLETEQSRKVKVTIPGELNEKRPHYEGVANLIRAYGVSGTGKRAVFEARGEIFTVPAEKGSVRNITKTSVIRERSPEFSPDGKWIAYFSDATGEYEIYLRKPDGTDEEVKLTRGVHNYPFSLEWSPDSKKILFHDQTFSIYYVDIDEKAVHKIDEDEWGDLNDYSWSADSKWIAYSKNGDNAYASIYLYNVDEGVSHKVTGDLYNEFNPVFDPEGKYLYFCSDRMLNFQFADFDYDVNYVYPTNICVATLKADAPSPLAPESDEVEVKEEEKKENGDEGEKKEDEKDAAKDEGEEKKGEKEEDKVLEIDIEGFENRIVALPIGMGNFVGLVPTEGKLFYAEIPRLTITALFDQVFTFTLKYFDLKERESKTVIGGINGYSFSADNKKVLYRAMQTFGIIDAAAGKNVGDGKIATDAMQMKVDPAAEWAQMFYEAWRIERDFFYVSNMHGVDWRKIKQRYEEFLPDLTTRDDLNYIIGEMIAELCVGHSYVYGGDYPGYDHVGGATLGCDFEIDHESNRYRISKIYTGRNWDPDFAAPLSQPGIGVKEGDYLLEINGVGLTYPDNPFALLETLAKDQVIIKVAADPDGADAKEFTVVPVPGDINLRYADWVESNRRKVLEASDGRIGYVHVPDTNVRGLMEFAKYFYGQTTLDGIIIDVRYNSGGWMPTLFTDRLARKIASYWGRRYGRVLQFPVRAPKGHLACVINAYAGSGGDAFPYLFRQAGLGPLIGKRTWGGLVGMNRNVPLMDGGYCTIPAVGFIDLDGEWAVENVGVSPDIEIDNRPDLVVEGHDPQLEKAVEYLLEKIRQDPPRTPKKPRDPNKG